MSAFDAWVKQGGSGGSVPGGDTDFVFETYGGIPNNSSLSARTTNSAVWNTIMTALGAMANSGGYLIFGAGDWYFKDTPVVSRNVTILGQGGFYGKPTTRLLTTGGKHGIQFDYDAGQSFTACMRDIGISPADPIYGWQALTQYSVGDIIRPTWYAGYLFTCTTAGTTAATEPLATWPIALGAIATPYPLDEVGGATLVDGTVTWTATFAHGIMVKSACYLERVYVDSQSGDGYHLYGATPTTQTALASFKNCHAVSCHGNGFYISGNDASAATFYGLNAIANEMNGVVDYSFLGNSHTGHHSRSNGPVPWIVGGSYSVGNRIQPSTANGYGYILTAATGTAPAEPVWPTTIGNSASSGSYTVKCMGRTPPGGGYYLRNSQGDFLYSEDDQAKPHISASANLIGGVLTPEDDFDASKGFAFLTRDSSSNRSFSIRSDNGDGAPIKTWLGSRSTSKWALSMAVLSGGAPITGTELVWAYDNTTTSKGWRLQLDSVDGLLIANGNESGTTIGDAMLPNGVWIGSPQGGSGGSLIKQYAYRNNAGLPTGGQSGDIYLPTANGPGAGFWEKVGSVWNGVGEVGGALSADITATVGSPYFVAFNDHNKLLRVPSGTGAKVGIHLGDPASPAFSRTLIQNDSTNGVRVIVYNPEVMLYGSVSSAAGGYIETTDVGATIELLGIDSNTFFITQLTGRWTFDGSPSLASPGVITKLSTTVVDTSLSTKQNLYTVPSGSTCVVTQVIARSPSATITTASGTIGYNAAADDVAIATMNLPNISGTFTISVPDGNGVNQAKLGVAAAVLGFKTTATDTPTLTIDVFGYLF